MHLYWEPGEVWRPVERLVIADCRPKSLMKAEHNFYRLMGEVDEKISMYSELEGPSPRSYGHWDFFKKKMVYEGGLYPNITQRQWLLWRELGAYCRPAWIIQGRKGGHPRHYSELEQGLRILAGKPKHPPAPGDLPYAPFSELTVRRLMELNRLRLWTERTGQSWKTRTPEDQKREKDEVKEQLSDAFAAWWDQDDEEDLAA